MNYLEIINIERNACIRVWLYLSFVKDKFETT